MTTSLLQRQLEPVTTGREKMVCVVVDQSPVVVLSQRFFDQVRPLLDYMASQPEVNVVRGGCEWSEEKNARRAALITKKHDHGLTAGEKQELQRLQAEVDEFAEREARPRNEVLELLLLGL